MRLRRAAGLTGVAGSVAVFLICVRPAYLGWGATDQECNETLPGDDLVGNADLTATRGITIRASADQTWPWIAQLGQGRGGFYSYDFLENLVGCDIHSVDHVVTEWQDIEVGHEVRLAPQVGLVVASLERGRSFVLRGGIKMGTTAPPYDFTWAFALRDQPDGATRLLVRERYAYTQPWARLLVEPVEVISYAMSQKMLRGIKDRAERHATPQHGEPEACPGQSGQF